MKSALLKRGIQKPNRAFLKASIELKEEFKVKYPRLTEKGAIEMAAEMVAVHVIELEKESKTEES